MMPPPSKGPTVTSRLNSGRSVLSTDHSQADKEVILNPVRCIGNIYNKIKPGSINSVSFDNDENIYFVVDDNLYHCVQQRTETKNAHLMKNISNCDLSEGRLVVYELSGAILVCLTNEHSDDMYEIIIDPPGVISRFAESDSKIRVRYFHKECTLILSNSQHFLLLETNFDEETRNFTARLVCESRFPSDVQPSGDVALWTDPDSNTCYPASVSANGELIIWDINKASLENDSNRINDKNIVGGDNQQDDVKNKLDSPKSISPTIISVQGWVSAVSQGGQLSPGILGLTGNSSGSVVGWGRPRLGSSLAQISEHTRHPDSENQDHNEPLQEIVAELSFSNNMITAILVNPFESSMWVADSGGSITEAYLDEDDYVAIIACRKISCVSSPSIHHLNWNSFKGVLTFLCSIEGSLYKAILPDTVETMGSVSMNQVYTPGHRSYISACALITTSDLLVTGSEFSDSVFVWDISLGKKMLELPLAPAVKGGGIGGYCSAISTFSIPTINSNNSVRLGDDASAGSCATLIAVGQSQGHLLIYEIVNRDFDIADEGSFFVSSAVQQYNTTQHIEMDLSENQNINKSSKHTKSAAKSVKKPAPVLYRALANPLNLSEEATSALEVAPKNSKLSKGTEKQISSRNATMKPKRDAKDSSRRLSGTHVSVLDIIEESSVASSKFTAKSIPTKIKRGKDDQNYSKGTTGDELDNISLSSTGMQDNPVIFNDDSAKNDLFATVAATEENIETQDVPSWSLRSRISIDIHCHLPVTDLFFSSKGHHIAIIYARKVLVVHSIIKSIAVRQLDFSNIISDVSALELSHLNEDTASAHLSSTLNPSLDSLVLVLHVKSDIRLYDAIAGTFLPSLNLSFIGNPLSTEKYSIWVPKIVENNIRGVTSISSIGDEFKDSIDLNTASFNNPPKSDLKLNALLGVYSSTSGEVFYMDLEREQRKRLIENISVTSDHLNNIMVGVHLFPLTIRSPTLVLAAYWLHSVAIKRLLFSGGYLTDNPSGNSSIHYRILPSTKCRVVFVGKLKTMTRSRTCRLIVVLSDGSTFTIRV